VDSASEGMAANAFDSNLATSLVQILPAGFVQTDFGDNNAVQVNSYGIFFTNAVQETWDVTIQGSQNGIVFTDLYSIFTATLSSVLRPATGSG